jgi:predicted DNA-binding protein
VPQLKKLEKLTQREGRAKAQVIREAVRRFLNRRTSGKNAFNFDASSAKGEKRIYPRFSKSDRDMLKKISKKTNRFRTDLVREAVEDYLREF